LGKDFDDYKDDDYDKNTGSYDYDDEMSRKAVGKLLTGLNDDENTTSSVKPVVRAIRINSEKIKKEKINTSFYDENRGKRNSERDDVIVTGFKEDDAFAKTEPEIPAAPEEDMGDTVRTRRPNILRDETGGDREERERYRKQFLGGYTDHRRKGIDLTGPAPGGETRKRPQSSSGDESIKRFPTERTPKDAENTPPLSPRRRPPREETTDIKPPQRGRRVKDADDEVTLIPKRAERKERPAYAAPASAANISYDAPIFKIIAAILLVMLIVMVILVFNVISANGTIRERDEQIAKLEEEVEEVPSMRMTISSLNEQVGALREERNLIQIQLEQLQGQLTPPDIVEPPAGYPSGDTQPSGGSQSYTVRSGDNLSRIAAQFNLGAGGVAAIMQANNITDASRIQVGQVLVIPTP